MSKADAVTRMSISGEMTIYSAGELKEALLAAVLGSDAVEVDLAQVNEFDTAGLQQLLLARREAARDGKSFSVREPSGAVSAVLDTYRMNGEMLESVDRAHEAAAASTPSGKRSAT
ncbi:MAG: lipid asymmetry maintenance protein MlaB [Gammaproteobacteria bacterium]